MGGLVVTLPLVEGPASLGDRFDRCVVACPAVLCLCLVLGEVLVALVLYTVTSGKSLLVL